MGEPSKLVEWTERIWRVLLYVAMGGLVLIVIAVVITLILGLFGIDSWDELIERFG
jgi:hypothetical protein